MLTLFPLEIKTLSLFLINMGGKMDLFRQIQRFYSQKRI